MGLNDLCERCKQLVQARLAHVHRDYYRNDVYLLLADDDDAYQMFEAESQFRLYAATKHIPKPKGLSLDTNAQDRALDLYANEQKLLLLRSVEDFRRGAAGGCHLCYLVEPCLRQLSGDIAPHVFGYPYFSPRSPFDDGSDSWGHMGWRFDYNSIFCKSKKLRVPSQETLRQIHRELEFPIRKSEQSAVPSVIDERIAGLRVATLRKIRRWLADCTGHHDGHVFCDDKDMGEPAEVMPVPKRLVRIEVLGSPSRTTLRLVDTSQDAEYLSKRPTYAAVSHCWGPAGVPVRLTKANYDKWMVNIPLRTLSKTFREAIMVAQALEIDYLWIDALCIIQDSPTDWQTEAPRMRLVYAGGLVTLAATASEDGRGGLFVPHTELPDTCTVRLNFRESHDTVLHGVWDIRGSSAHPRSSYDCCIRSAPLNSRAWVMQEKLLSRRLIHFTSNEVWWQCPASSEKETWASNLSLSNSFDDWETQHFRDAKWTGLVEIYMQKKLSFPEDRLVAFAAIAEAFAQHHQLDPSTYCAGLWRHGLESQLLWLPAYTAGFSATVSSTIPSWSWASCPVPVVYSYGLNRDGANTAETLTIVRVDVKLEGSSPFGNVSEGRLYVESPILKITSYWRSAITVEAFDGTICHLSHTDADSNGLGEHDRGAPMSSLAIPTHALPLTHFYDPWDSVVDDIHRPANPHIFGLLLLRSVDGPRGTYTRTGVWYTAVHAGQHDRPAWWTAGSKLDESSYFDGSSSGRYRIVII